MKKFSFSLLVASNNQAKLREMKILLEPLFTDVICPNDIGLSFDVEENGVTFQENAFIKAEYVHRLRPDVAVVSDDSGLCVEALNGAPGVYTARYAGEHATDAQNIDKLLYSLNGVENRNAYFESYIALVMPSGERYGGRGTVAGKILEERVGVSGFGYDPVFYSFELGKSFGVACDEEKNSVSHRSRAIRDMICSLTSNRTDN